MNKGNVIMNATEARKVSANSSKKGISTVYGMIKLACSKGQTSVTCIRGITDVVKNSLLNNGFTVLETKVERIVGKNKEKRTYSGLIIKW